METKGSGIAAEKTDASSDQKAGPASRSTKSPSAERIATLESECWDAVYEAAKHYPYASKLLADFSKSPEMRKKHPGLHLKCKLLVRGERLLLTARLAKQRRRYELFVAPWFALFYALIRMIPTRQDRMNAAGARLASIRMARSSKPQVWRGPAASARSPDLRKHG